MREKIKVNYILQNCKTDTGISRYANSLIKYLDNKINIAKIKPKFFLNYAYRVKPKFQNGVFHFTEQSLASPLIFKQYAKSIVTVHDLIPLKFDLFSKLKKRPFKKIDEFWYKQTLKSLNKAERVITVSENTKKDLINELDIPKEKIKVIYEGVEKEFKIKNIPKDPLRILFVGNEFPHKNFRMLLEGIKLLKQKLPLVKLIKIGNALWPGARDDNLRLIKRLNLENNVIFKDYIGDIIEEYNRASLVVLPSLYEGFGFPIIEAMACGCPVIGAKNASIPEIIKDAGLLFNPNDKFELEEKMYLVLTNERIKKMLITKGVKRAKYFNWEKTAEKTLEVYKQIN